MKVGSIQLKTKTIASIFSNSNDGSVLAVISDEKVPDEMVLAVTNTLFQQLPSTKEVIIFDSYLASNYITANRQERESVPNLKCLRSSTFAKSPKVNLLSPPNLATGMTAAILTHCELHQLPCVALFTLQESSLGKALITDDMAAAFATVLAELDVNYPLLDYSSLQSILQSRKFGKDSGRIDADHHRMYT
ncbi:hypothetical protein BGW37DRAFT_477781 [Umbelopsis sp. PMI_123]|nr:hypothetical protein BGW37DRAFT_477781 [Umbelopsis sp. PMI_123]